MSERWQSWWRRQKNAGAEAAELYVQLLQGPELIQRWETPFDDIGEQAAALAQERADDEGQVLRVTLLAERAGKRVGQVSGRYVPVDGDRFAQDAVGGEGLVAQALRHNEMMQQTQLAMVKCNFAQSEAVNVQLREIIAQQARRIAKLEDERAKAVDEAAQAKTERTAEMEMKQLTTHRLMDMLEPHVPQLLPHVLRLLTSGDAPH